jgi:outer membrane protein OmpA-like peptidoglycan-associated protein
MGIRSCATIIGIGVSMLVGCGGSAQSEARFTPGQSHARIQTIHENGSWRGADDRADTRGAKVQGAPKDQSLSVTGVTLDPSIASACGIAAPNAFFEFDSAQIESQNEGTLYGVARCLSEGPLKGQRIEIVGHTDPRGTDEYNYQLGKSRAQSVSEYLSSHGVNQGNLSVVSYGESLSSATDERGWAYERRVDIRLLQ